MNIFLWGVGMGIVIGSGVGVIVVSLLVSGKGCRHDQSEKIQD